MSRKPWLPVLALPFERGGAVWVFSPVSPGSTLPRETEGRPPRRSPRGGDGVALSAAVGLCPPMTRTPGRRAKQALLATLVRVARCTSDVRRQRRSARKRWSVAHGGSTESLSVSSCHGDVCFCSPLWPLHQLSHKPFYMSNSSYWTHSSSTQRARRSCNSREDAPRGSTAALSSK